MSNANHFVSGHEIRSLIDKPTGSLNLSSNLVCFFALSIPSTNLYLAPNLGYHWASAWDLEAVCGLNNFVLCFCRVVFCALEKWKNNWRKCIYTENPIKKSTMCINRSLKIHLEREAYGGHKQKKWINTVIQHFQSTLCPPGLTAKLNFNISKVVFCNLSLLCLQKQNSSGAHVNINDYISPDVIASCIWKHDQTKNVRKLILKFKIAVNRKRNFISLFFFYYIKQIESMSPSVFSVIDQDGIYIFL